MMGQSKTLSCSQIIFITLFSASTQRYRPPPQNYAIMLSQNHSPDPKPAFFDFSSSNVPVQDHILSTAGDALIVLGISQSTHWTKLFVSVVFLYEAPFFCPGNAGRTGGRKNDEGRR
jgi:hypothetical protein